MVAFVVAAADDVVNQGSMTSRYIQIMSAMTRASIPKILGNYIDKNNQTSILM